MDLFFPHQLSPLFTYHSNLTWPNLSISSYDADSSGYNIISIWLCRCHLHACFCLYSKTTRHSCYHAAVRSITGDGFMTQPALPWLWEENNTVNCYSIKSFPDILPVYWTNLLTFRLFIYPTHARNPLVLNISNVMWGLRPEKLLEVFFAPNVVMFCHSSNWMPQFPLITSSFLSWTSCILSLHVLFEIVIYCVSALCLRLACRPILHYWIVCFNYVIRMSQQTTVQK